MTVEPTLKEIYERFECENRAQRLVDAEPELYRLAGHESGHDLIAEHFGLNPDLHIVSGEGVCVHRPGTSLQNAAISWGGVMAEELLNAPQKDRVRPRTKLHWSTVLQWSSEILTHHLSPSDREGIDSHPSHYESCKLAFEILSNNLEVLEYLARSRADGAREAFGKSLDRPACLNRLEIERFCWERNEAARERLIKERQSKV